MLQSSLGEPLRVSIPLVNADASDEKPQCIKVKVSSLDSGVLIAAKASMARNAQSAAIQLTTLQNINELAVNIAVSIGCTAMLHRDYQVLLDPSETLPANREPLPPKSAPLSTGIAVSLPPATAQPNANTFARSKRQLIANHGQSHRPRLDPDTALASAPLKNSPRISRATTKRISHDVLSLSMPDPQTMGHEFDGQHTGLNLKLATTLSAPTIETETDPRKLADIRVENDRLAALWRDEDPAKITAMRMKVVQDEMHALREENGRSKQQNESNKAALQAALNELRYWIGGLGAVLLICFGSIGWMLWRSFTGRNNDGHTSWKRIVENHGPDSGENAHATDAADLNYSTTVDDPWAHPPIAAAPPFAAAPPSPPPALFAVAPWPPPAQDDKKVPAPSQYTPESLNASELERDLEWDHPREPSEVLNVAEVTDVTELAEVWMAIHQDPMKLLELLEPFKDLEKPDSALPWICLLDVYRAIGDSANYEAMQQHIEKTFNVHVPSWDAEPDIAHIRNLSDFSRITEKILNLWDSPEILPYLQELLYDQRDGERDGFDLPVYRAIMQVYKLASAPNRSKWHYHKTYAILTGATKNELDNAPSIFNSDATKGEAALGKAGDARFLRHPTSDNLNPTKDYLSAARSRATEREWLFEEDTTLAADSSLGNATAAAGETPVHSKASTQVVNELEDGAQESQDWTPTLISSALVSSQQTCLNTAMLDQMTPGKILQISFPHIWQRISDFAIEPKRLRKYLLSLSIQDRTEKRAGFSMEALKEISDIQIQNDWFLVKAATSWQVGTVNT